MEGGSSKVEFSPLFLSDIDTLEVNIGLMMPWIRNQRSNLSTAYCSIDWNAETEVVRGWVIYSTRFDMFASVFTCSLNAMILEIG